MTVVDNIREAINRLSITTESLISLRTELKTKINVISNVISLNTYRYKRFEAGLPIPDLFIQLEERKRLKEINKNQKILRDTKEERRKHNERVKKAYFENVKG